MFPTYEKIKELADKKGISLTKLEEDLGYSRNTLYKLKSQRPNIGNRRLLPSQHRLSAR